ASILRGDVVGSCVNSVNVGNVDVRHVPHDHPRAFGFEGRHRGAADSGRASGDDDDLVFEVQVHRAPVIPSVQRGTWVGGASKHVRRTATRAPDPSLTLGMTIRTPTARPTGTRAPERPN